MYRGDNCYYERRKERNRLLLQTMRITCQVYCQLAALLLLASAVGCGRTAEASKDWNRDSMVTKEQALSIAEQEVKKRGWINFTNIGCDLQGNRWVIRLERLPEVFGGHATVEVSTNGAVRYVPGR